MNALLEDPVAGALGALGVIIWFTTLVSVILWIIR